MAKYVKKYPDENRGRPATGCKPVHAFNFRLDMDTYGWIMATKPEAVSLTKYINQIIRERAGL